MPVKKLKELLNELDDDYILIPNRVENLSIIEADTNKIIGYIDFVEYNHAIESMEELEWYWKEEEDGNI